MRSILARALLVVGLSGPVAVAAAPPPLSAYSQLPAIDRVVLSPDGSRYAAIVGDDKQAQIQVRSLADGKLISVSDVDKAKARRLGWAGNDHVLAMISTTEKPPRGITGGVREWYHAQDLDLTTRTSKRLMDKVKDTMNIVLAMPLSVRSASDPQVVVPGMPFVYTQGNAMVGVLGLYRVDLKTAKTQLFETGREETQDFLVDGDGKAVARADYDSVKAEWSLWLRGADGWQKVLVETADIDRPDLLAIDSDGQRLLIGSYRGEGYGVHAVPLTPPPKGVMLEWGAAVADIGSEGLMIDPVTRRLIGTVETTMEGYRYRFRDPADQRSWEAIAKAFPGEVVTLSSWSDDRMVVIVHVEGQKNGDGYFVVDRRKREAKPLGSRYPAVPIADIGENRVIRYKAGDGLEIPAYLTLPPGRPAKALPLIVFPHGGPVARDDPGFDWWTEAMASRGYAVLRPQFRGSDGLGDALREAAWGEWGKKMQTDLSDGVSHLVAQGIVDPSRVCIVGASYGGYAALAGVTLQQGIYRCAASVAGLSDLRRFLGGKAHYRITPKRSASLRFWLRLMGADSNTDPMLDTLSPAKLADRVTVPVQLIHGKDDTVVDYLQTSYMADALARRGKPAEVVTLVGEDHWLSKATTRVELLDALMAFLEKHNPPDRTAGSSAAQ
jgi:dipeptidyl aminopeptidase/acylaminoacyl peptidase